MNEMTSYDMDEMQARSEKEYPWAIFSIANTEYAINSKYVLCFESLNTVTPIVNSQSYCPGITESRGELIELIDLRALFNMESYTSLKKGDDDEKTMMVVIEIDGVKRGMIVDKIVSVEYVSNFVEGVVSENNGTISSPYISQIAIRDKLDSPLMLFNPNNLSGL